MHVSTNILDLTARNAALAERSARREAEFARAAAELASRAKSDFLSTMSHELRTPLSAIVGFTELLETLDLSGERRATALGHIARAAKHILAILDDVLDLAKVEAGAVAIESVPVRLAPVVLGVREMLEPLAADRGLRIDAADLDEDAVALADPRRLQQVLLNIVSNAIKYNRPDGFLRITVAVDAVPGRPRAVVSVSDTGLGIPEEMRERLFTPFDRLGAEQLGEPGSGLGLVVSDRLVAAMGGTLEVLSRPGTGTTVTIGFPARPASDLPAGDGVAGPRRAPRAAGAGTGQQARGRVLYVEDDAAHRTLVAEVLSVRPGVEVVGCGHAREALELARAHPPDLVLLDLDLPELPGEELLAALRADPALARVPVWVLSGRRPLGRPDIPCLPKPLDAAALLDVLDRELGAGAATS